MMLNSGFYTNFDNFSMIYESIVGADSSAILLHNLLSFIRCDYSNKRDRPMLSLSSLVMITFVQRMPIECP